MATDTSATTYPRRTSTRRSHSAWWWLAAATGVATYLVAFARSVGPVPPMPIDAGAVPVVFAVGAAGSAVVSLLLRRRPDRWGWGVLVALLGLSVVSTVSFGTGDWDSRSGAAQLLAVVSALAWLGLGLGRSVRRPV